MDFLPDFGNLIYTVVAFVIALSVIVTVHEYGHYIIGRLSGIRAEAFSIGFGPALLKRTDKRGTVWKISAIPLGGYVKFLGDANVASAGVDSGTMDALSPEERRHTMHGAPLWARAATVAAGPIFNFLLSIVIFAAAMIWSGTATDEPTVGEILRLPTGTAELRVGDRILAVNDIETPDYPALQEVLGVLPSTPTLPWKVTRDGVEQAITGPQPFPPVLAGVAPQSAAYDAGLKADDVITAIDGAPIWRFAELQEKVKAANGADLRLSIWRPEGERSFDVTLAPRRMDLPTAEGGFETRWLIGATGSFVFEPATRATGLFEAVSGGARQVWATITTSLSALEHIVLGKISTCNLHGAIGIAEGSAAAAKSGPADFIWFIAVLSTAVGFLNLFPIPMLDGGHLMFHLWEGITGKPPSHRVMNGMMAVGVTLVLSLMLFGLWNDITC